MIFNKVKWLVSGILTVVLAVGVVYWSFNSKDVQAKTGSELPQTKDAVFNDPAHFVKAPVIAEKIWINSEPIDWQSLRGKVVVVDFWTFACYNCKNTLPFFKAWDQKYRHQGLTIIGVHTPELSFEKNIDNVRKAVSDYGVQYPVVIDGNFTNWNRYGVWAWPTWFIVDKKGNIRYSHVGEGDYDGSEKMIQKLLAE